MINNTFTSLHLLLITIISTLLFQPSQISTNPHQFYNTCNNTTFTCGNAVARIGYPFRGPHDPPYCGHPGFVLACDGQNNATTIDIMSTTYRVLEIRQTARTMRIVREDLMEGACPKEIANATLDYTLFEYSAAYMNFTFLYGCPKYNIPGLSVISCGGYDGSYVLPGNRASGNCNASVVVPVLVTGDGDGDFGNSTGLDRVIQRGFEIRWKIDSKACGDCTESNGRCGFSFETNRTTCFCPDPPYVSDTCVTASRGGASPANRQSVGT